MSQEMSAVLGYLYIGGKSDAKDKAKLQKMGIKYILNCTPPRTLDRENGCPNFYEKEKAFVYKRISIFDNKGEDILSHLETAYNFIEEGNSGIYRNTTFVPVINQTYILTIIYNGETYTATETLKSVVDIDFVEQNDNGGFSGTETELKAYYTDPEDEENYYFFEFISDIPVIPTLEVYEDEFTNGNQIFGFYTEAELEAGDQVIIRNYGVSERFYEFMFILLQQNSEEGGGPFETQPATIRGNCINQTNPDNFPLGYFRLSEVVELIYTVQ